MTIRQHSIELSNTRINYLASGHQHEVMLVLLHGFPENSWCWEQYLEGLSTDYHVVAPDLPGYNCSPGFDTESGYHVQNLVSCMAEFMSRLRADKPVHLVAHDWGGVIAWPLVAFHADNFRSLTILNAAHPSTFTREMLHNQKQQAASDYISDLISERGYNITTANDYAMLKGLYAKGFKHLSENYRSKLLAQWSDRHSMQQAFNYYRQMPVLHTPRAPMSNQVKIPRVFIKKPTLVLWGMQDTAFVPEVLDGMQEWVEHCQVVKFEQDDHWLHHRKPTEVMAYIRQHVKINA